ncbi:MAG: right-handed parallel beta-helix repeat-containing protein [Clostridia bacterium]|nr:right-handed parallel beta-helix repeat-containing protein [Clostridia bacterium]
MQTNIKKVLSFLLVCAIFSSLAAALIPATWVFGGGEVVSPSDAPYAGVYQVTSDKAVTLTNETGHTVTLKAGVTDYFYLIQGNNNITKSDASASLTFTALDGNGLDYIGEVTMTEEPILPGDTGDTIAGFANVTLTPGAKFTTTYTPGVIGAGLAYPYIAPSVGAGNSVRVTTDTGYYADIYLAYNYNSSAWADAARQDPEMLYVRDGEQEITIENIGSSTVTLYSVGIRTTGVLAEADYWKDQMNMASLKVVPYSSTPTPTPEVIPTITYTAPYAGVYQVTSDKAVTLTNETGHTVTLTAGVADYFYLIKGENTIETTDTSITLTATPLDGNGLDYIGEVTMTEEPILPGDTGDLIAGFSNVTLAPGATFTATYTPNVIDAGLVYPYIAPASGQGNSVRVTTDTGYYADIYLANNYGSSAWADADRKDPEMLYVRDGEQEITIENIGSSAVTLYAVRIQTTGVLAEADYWKDQMNMASLKVVPYQIEPDATPVPTIEPTPTPDIVTYNALYAGVHQVTSDKAVTLQSETNSVAELAAGETKYIYLIAGANKIQTTNKDATLTFTNLKNNGLAYIDQIVTQSVCYAEGHTETVNSMLYLGAGESITLTATVNASGAGIVYPYINVQDNSQHTFYITSDTGFYADITKDSTGWQSTCWVDGSAQQDMEFLYVREGANQITLTNTGSNTATIGSLRLSQTAETAIKDHAVWGSQVNLKSLKTLEVEIPDPTPPPAPTYAPVGTISYTAEHAGIYRVASDKAVTLIHENGSTATLSGSGTVKYLFLIKGENILSTSDLSADIAFTALDGYGMTYMSKIETAFVPYSEEHITVDIHNIAEGDGTYETGTADFGKFVNLNPGASLTFEVTVSSAGAGIVYPYLGFSDVLENTFVVTSDTGLTAEIVKPAAGGSFCWADGDEKQDMEFLYLREGKNLVTITNAGANTATLSAFRLSMTAGEDSIQEHEVWGSQINLQNLKVFTGSTSVEPTATPAPILPDVSNTNLYTVIEAETAGTPVTYNGKTALKIGNESTATYTLTVEQETIYHLNLVGAAWKDVSFDLYVDNTLVDYATMHFGNDRSDSAWVYLQEEVATLHLDAGTHTLKFEFYCDTFYFDSIVLEDTNSMAYHLIHDFETVTTAEGAYDLLKKYGEAANIDVEADTSNHVYAPMSFWNMVAKKYETSAQMLDAYNECIVDPVVTVKDSGGQEVDSLPAGNAYVTASCINLPSDTSLIAAVYSGKKLADVTNMTRSGDAATAVFTNLAEGCTLKVFVFTGLDNVTPYSKDVYGTPYREFYVSATGKSSNPGTQLEPVNNLANAMKLVKSVNADMTGDIIVHVAPGTYKSSVAINIDPTMGGKNGHKVIIRAEDMNNKPVFSGGEDLSGKWSKVDGENYYVAKTSTRETRALFVNGYQATMARSSGWYTGVLMDPAEKKNDSHVTDGIMVSFYGNSDFPRGLDQQTQVQKSRMQIVFSLAWANHRFPLDDITYDSGNAYVHTTYPYYNAFCIDGLHTDTITPDGGSDFYIENSLLLLDQPGEFYFDKETQKMYYYPYANENMATADTWCAVTDGMLNITGISTQNKVTNLEFDGISFRYGGYDDITVKGAAFNQTDEWRLGSETYYGQHIFPGQIWVKYADSLVFKNCEFSSMGSSAVILEEGVSNSQFTRSYFHDLAGTGIMIGDYRDGNAASVNTERCKNITVDNNIFRRTAQEFQGLTAISLYYASGVSIHHNDIKDTPYSGIVIGWGWGYDDPAECGHHTISYNKIDDVMQTMGDGGHIYTLGNLRGTQINDNYLIDPGQILAPGIYFDQGTGYTNACDNVVTDAYDNSNEYWFFARQYVNINNCFAGYNHTDGRNPARIFGSNATNTNEVLLQGNNYRVTSYDTTAQKIMAEAGVEDKTRLNEIDTYPSWRTMRMMDIPAQ